MWPPLLYSDLPYHIICTPTRSYTGDFGDFHGDFGDFTYPNSSLPNPTTPNPTHPYPDLPYYINLPLLDPTMVISVIPMVISVVISVISVFPATRLEQVTGHGLRIVMQILVSFFWMWLLVLVNDCHLDVSPVTILILIVTSGPYASFCNLKVFNIAEEEI